MPYILTFIIAKTVNVSVRTGAEIIISIKVRETFKYNRKVSTLIEIEEYLSLPFAFIQIVLITTEAILLSSGSTALKGYSPRQIGIFVKTIPTSLILVAVTVGLLEALGEKLRKTHRSLRKAIRNVGNYGKSLKDLCRLNRFLLIVLLKLILFVIKLF